MSQAQTLLAALKRGEKLTVLTALKRYQTFALSQRMGDLVRAGHRIKSQMVRIKSGKRIAQYSL